ncbi:hypothetical protein SAMN05444000_11015 [Shimia gijangensis]|uniref:Tetratricopeptide repeat-containing protein n=1 Tax=Shimia gijangensis TaxID=1470563 RepID=A0A1M6K6I3_9RHOB|nr:hypothetical protein SAMN05444000_11015 [Shimia gijangensis]
MLKGVKPFESLTFVGSKDDMGSAENHSDLNTHYAALASRTEILEALERIKSDESFAGASRLVDLLDYIVTKHLADPERKILAKIIAEDLYDRALDQDTDSHNIVRVDAGRLRRRLAEYYVGPGQNEPLLIHVDPGAYVPRFEVRSTETSPRDATPKVADAGLRRSQGSMVIVGAVLVALGCGFLLGTITSLRGHPDAPEAAITPTSGDPKLEAERRARMSKSPSSLQAVTLSDHARNLIFPMFEREQLKLSLAMFRQAIRKDDTYFGGYAGAAQCLAAMALFLSDGPDRSGLLAESRKMVDRAIEQSPTNSWSQSALSWTLLVEGRDSEAREHAELALDLAPKDGNVLDFYAVVMLLTGEFDAAREAADPDRERTSAVGRHADQSLYGAASFHLGLYQDAIDTLIAASLSGSPISAPNYAYLSASYQGLGEVDKARKYAFELMENWPEFNPSVVFGRIYSNPDQVKGVTDKLLAAGWQQGEP